MDKAELAQLLRKARYTELGDYGEWAYYKIADIDSVIAALESGLEIA